jgi:hypothetical protein
MRGGEGLPLTGVSYRSTGLCIAGNSELVFESDAHGFRNPRDVNWAGPADVAVIGDSFAQGYCMDDSASVTGRIRARFPQTVNLGVTGAGPLWELGVLREYAAPIQPSLIVWMFFEGNDLETVGVERSGFAGSYLDPAFTQHLRTRQRDIDQALGARLDSIARSFLPDIGERLKRLISLREVRARLALNLRAREGVIPDSGSGVDGDVAILSHVLARAASEASAWGGTVLFVYLPERPRFADEMRGIPEGSRPGHYSARERVLRAASAAGMQTLDMTPAFAARPDPLALWDDGMVHYNSMGYALVADSVLGRTSGARTSQDVRSFATDRWIPVGRLAARNILMAGL